MKKLIMIVLLYPYIANSQITDIASPILEISEAIADIFKKVQDYNHHQLESGDHVVDEKLTLEFKKLENINRAFNEILMSGELNDILEIIKSADRIRSTINDLAVKFDMPKLDQITSNSLTDLFDLSELSITEKFNINDLKPLEHLRNDEKNLELFNIKTKVNTALELFKNADSYQKKASVIDRDLSATTVREYVVDAIGVEILNFSIQDFMLDMFEEVVTNCDGDEYDIFIDNAIVLAKAETDIKEAELTGVGYSTAIPQKAIAQTNYDHAKQRYYRCKNNAGENKKRIEAYKNALKEVMEIILYIYGIDFSDVFNGLTETKEEPLLIMDDSQRLQTMELRNQHLTTSMKEVEQAVKLLNEAAQSTDVSNENIGYKERKIFTDILTSF